MAGKIEIAREVSEVMEWSILHARDKGFKVVEIVQKVMTEALCRGETIRIMGIGTFTVKYRKPRRHYVAYYPYLPKRLQHTEIKMSPGKFYVQFTPSGTLVESLNHPD